MTESSLLKFRRCKKWPVWTSKSYFWCKNSHQENNKEQREFKRRWRWLNIPTTGLYKALNPMCFAAVQIIWSRLERGPPAQGVWVARSALAPEQLHWASAQITSYKKYGNEGGARGGLMEWPQTTCTVVRVFPEVAYVGGCSGWWVEQPWRHCSLRLRGLLLVSVSL